MKHLVDRPDGKAYCFRVHNERVFYLSEEMVKKASCISRKQLMVLGTKFGRFTHKRNFRLHISCLDYLNQLAQHKVWIKPSAEMSFLYGNHVTKAGIGRMSDGVPQYGGVIVNNMAGTPLGFGVAAQSTEFTQEMNPTAFAILHQADVGEYLRDEATAAM